MSGQLVGVAFPAAARVSRDAAEQASRDWEHGLPVSPGDLRWLRGETDGAGIASGDRNRRVQAGDRTLSDTMNRRADMELRPLGVIRPGEHVNSSGS